MANTTVTLSTGATQAKRSIVFISPDVQNYDTLIADLGNDVDVYVLNANQDGLLQMTSILQGVSGLDAIHIISHGSSGSISLGSGVLNSTNIADYSAALSQIGSSLSETGDLLLYGCDVAQGMTGQAFIEQLSQLTGADVAASTDLTGAANLGGNWVLEAQTGSIEANRMQLAYSGVLLNNAPTFTVGDGKVTTSIGLSYDFGRSVTLQADGKILVAGDSWNDIKLLFALVRYNSDGTLDTSFDSDGIVTTPVSSSWSSGESVTVQADGKILVAGDSWRWNKSYMDFALVRYNSDGTLDTSFDSDGIVTTPVSSFGGSSYSVTVQADGKILVAGYSWNGSNVDFALVRYNSDGTLDTSFDSDGIVTTPVSSFGGSSYSVTVQADGKILLAGSSNNGSNFDFALVRYNSDGTLDTSFDSDGIVTTPIGLSDDTSQSVTVQADGKILVAGSSWNSSNMDFALVRYNSDGTLDTSFDGDGIVTTPVSSFGSGGCSVTVQADGKILVAGSSSNGSNADFALVRYNPDGSLDTTFDADGIITSAIGSSHDTAGSVALQVDGKILVTGSSSNGSNTDFALVRYNSDGSLDTSFDPINTLNSVTNYNGVAVLLDNSVSIYDVELAAQDNYAGASITLERNGGANVQDVFGATGNLSFNAGDAILSNVTIGTVTNTNGVFNIAFNSNATQARVNEALSSITYSNSSDNPASRIAIDWIFNDGSVSTAGSTTVNIPAANHAPVLSSTPAILADGIEGSPYTIFASDLLQGFSDVDTGDVLSIDILNVSHGSLLDNHDGSWTFIPEANYNGTVSLDYFVVDNSVNTGSVAATQSFNLAPVGVLADGYEDTAYTINASDLLQGFSGNQLVVDSLIADYGSINDNGDGTWTLIPTADYFGSVNLTYNMIDGSGNIVQATQGFYLAAVNDAPVLSADQAVFRTGTEDTAYQIVAYRGADALLRGFSDPDGDYLYVDNLTADHGILTVTQDQLGSGRGSWEFMPEANYNGLVTLSYNVSDHHGGSIAATQSFSLDAVNDVPVLSGTAVVLPDGTEGSPYTILASDLLQGFTDADGDTLSAVIYAGSFGVGGMGDNGVLTDNGNGTWTFTPNTNYNGEVVLIYEVLDGNGGSSGGIRQSFFLTALNVNNNAPTGVATAILLEGTEDTSYLINTSDLLQGFTDLDGDSLSVANLSSANGTFTDNGDGSWTFTPSADYNGTVTLSYNVIDGQGGSVAATQQFNLLAVNDAPVLSGAQASLIAGTEDAIYTINASNLLQGFNDVDGDVLSVDSLTVSNGVLTDNADGSWTFTPLANYNGTGTLSYNVVDANGGITAATQSFNLTSVNDAPVLSNLPASLPEGTKGIDYTIYATDLLHGFSDVDGDTLSVVNLSATNGVLTDNANGSWTFTAPSNFTGAVDLLYDVVDGNGGSVATALGFLITVVNNAPIGSATASLTDGLEDTAYTIKVSDLVVGFSDMDGDALFIEGLTASNGSLTDNADGTLRFDPIENFNGTVDLSYLVSDGNGASVAATQHFNIAAVNDAPILSGTVVTLTDGTEDIVYTINASDLLQGFSDIEGDALSVANLTSTNGTFTAIAGGWNFTPAANYNGMVAFSYDVVDGHGGSLAATQSFNLVAVNDAPVLSGTKATLAAGTEDTAYTILASSLLQGFIDAEGDALSVANLTATNGTLTAVAGGWNFTPAANYNGVVALSYDVVDGNGGSVSATQNFTLQAVNDVPTFSTLGNGIVTSPMGTSTDYGHSVTLQTDGKILVAGTSMNGSYGNFALARYNPDGSLDTTFDTDGKVITPIAGSNADDGYSVAVQTDGKILVGGISNNGSNNDFALVRYNADGSLDNSFGAGGKITTPIGTTDDYAYSLKIQTDGKILVSGFTITNNGHYNFALARYNTDGSLDNTFGTGGKVTSLIGSDSVGYAMTTQADGKILMAGYASGNADYDFALVRYNSDGSLDSTFDSDGKVTTPIGAFNDFAQAITVQADGKVLVAGTSYADQFGINKVFSLARYNSDGSLDSSFGTVGKVTTDVSAYDDIAYSVTVQADGKIIIAGTTANSTNDFALLRYNSDGSLDTTFDTDGIVITPTGSSHDISYSAILQTDGKILVAGQGGNNDFALARYNSNGSLDTSFDTISTLNGTASYTENGTTVTLDNSVQIYDVELAAQGNYAGASITLARNGGANSEDLFASTANLSFSGSNVILSGITIGTFTQSNGTLSIMLNNDATQTRVNTALSSLTYSNSSDAPPSTVVINWTFNDGNGDSTTGSTAVNITAINDAPILSGALAKLADGVEDTTYTINASNLLQGFIDVEGDVLSVANLTATNGTLTTVAGGWNFTPAANYNGVVALSYDVVDGNGGSTAATQSFNLTAVNDAPVLSGTKATLAAGTEDTAYTILASSLLQGFSDVEGDALSVANLTATNGTLTAIAGGWRFTPALNYNGAVNLSYDVVDGHGGSVAVTQNFNLAAVNDVPVLSSAKAILAAGTEDTVYTISASSLLQGFTDVDGDTLSVAGLTANHGTLTAVAGGWQFTPAQNYNGAVALSYNVVDGHGGSIVATQSFNLVAVNDAPVLTGAKAVLLAGTEDTAYTISTSSLLQGFTDVDSSTLSVVNLTATNGTLATIAGGWRFTPSANYNGLVSLNYNVVDGSGGVTAATQSFNLAPVNDAPVLSSTKAILAAGTEDTVYTISANSLLQGYSDVDGNSLSVAGLTATNGTLAVIAGGWNFIPAANYNGIVSLNYNVVDGQGGSVAASNSFSLAAVIDTVSSSTTTTLSAYVENLLLTGSANINGTGNAVNNQITGNAGNNTLDGLAGDDTLFGGAGADTLIGNTGNDSLNGGEGADILIGGSGKDSYNLAETVQSSDILRIAATDSTVALFDVATGFRLGSGASSAGVDKLDLVSTIIAANGTGNGTDVGTGANAISSHSISNGIISFDNLGAYNVPVAVTAANLSNVLTYLQAEIANGSTVAFTTADTHDTYVFQGGATDTLVELMGVTAQSINTTGVGAGAVWIM